MKGRFPGNKQLLNIMLHALIWLVLLVIPYLFNINDSLRFYVVVKRFWLPIGFSAAIFYLNYFLFTDQLFFKKRIGAFVFINVVMIAVSFWANIYLKGLFPPTNNVVAVDTISLSRVARIRELSRYSSVVSFLLSVVFCIVLKMTNRWMKIEAEKERAEKMHFEAELIHLRYQLQPHFFFNSLNNIYALIDKSPHDAKKALHGLGKLMRYLLYETDIEKISLDTEIDFLIKYIQLMELRLTKNIIVEYEFPEDGALYKVVPLLFVPLIENAFKHGIPIAGNAAIYIKMEVSQQQLVFTVSNPNAPKDYSDALGSGIGLDNLRKRLELIYPGLHTFTCNVKDGKYIASLVLNFH